MIIRSIDRNKEPEPIKVGLFGAKLMNNCNQKHSVLYCTTYIFLL